jgi:hypothetical protein
MPRRRDKETQMFVPTVDITPAMEHGEIVNLLPSEVSFYAVGDMAEQLRPRLKHYNYEDGDSIVSIGDPAIMAVVFGMVGNMHGKFYLLKWDRTTSRYNKMRIVL